MTDTMDIINAIRSLIFCIPVLMLILITDKVFKFQIYLIGKINIKYKMRIEILSLYWIHIYNHFNNIISSFST